MKHIKAHNIGFLAESWDVKKQLKEYYNPVQGVPDPSWVGGPDTAKEPKWEEPTHQETDSKIQRAIEDVNNEVAEDFFADELLANMDENKEDWGDLFDRLVQEDPNLLTEFGSHLFSRVYDIIADSYPENYMDLVQDDIFDSVVSWLGIDDKEEIKYMLKDHLERSM